MNIWSILEIDATRDRETIVEAYRSKLQQVHPEEDPEGFKALRAAYDEALRLIDAPEENQEVDNSPTGLWIQRVQKVYENFAHRIDSRKWQELLEDPIPSALENIHQAGEALLVFLMSNYRLPQDIYLMLDRHFSWRENIEELYQEFPPNFINYIFSVIDNGVYYNFQWFDGDDYAAYDEYLPLADELYEQVDRKNYEEAEKTLIKLDAMEITHPYVELDRIQVALHLGNLQLADSASMAVIADYPEDFTIRDVRADVLWRLEQFEEAMEIYKALNDINPKYLKWHVKSIENKIRMGEYLTAKEDYYQLMKDYYYDLLNQFNYEDTFQPMIAEANKNLIPYYEERYAKGELSSLEKFNMAWCYYESDQEKEAMEVIQSFQPDQELYKKYNKLKGILYQNQGEKEKALEHLEIWLQLSEEELMKDTESGMEEAKLNSVKSDIGNIYRMTAFLHQDLGNKAKAMETMKRVLELNPNDLSFYMNYIYLLGEEKKDLEIIKVCTEAMERNGQALELLVQRCMANFRMGDFGGSYNDAQEILSIRSDFIIAYIYKLKCLLMWSLENEYLETMEDMEQYAPDEVIVELYKIKNMRMNRETDQAIARAKTLLQKVNSKEEKVTSDNYDLAEINYELFLLYDSMEKPDFKKCLGYIEEAMKLEPENMEYVVNKGYLLEKMEQYDKAEELYLSQLDRYPDQVDMLICLGVLNYNRGRYEKALSYEDRMFELYPGYNTYLYSYAKDSARIMNDYPKAIGYITSKLSYGKNLEDLIERGTLYMENLQLKEAIADLEEAKEMDDSESQLYTVLGMTYALQGDYAEAERNFLEAVENDNGRNFGYNQYYHLGKLYFATKKYPEAIRVSDFALERFDNPVWAVERKLESLVQLGKIQEAIQLGKDKIAELNDLDDMNVIRTSMVTAYLATGDMQGAAKLVETIAKSNNSSFSARSAGFNYEFRLGEFEEATKQYNKVQLEQPNQFVDLINLVGSMWHKLQEKPQKSAFSFLGGNKQEKTKAKMEEYLTTVTHLIDGYLKNSAPFAKGCDLASVAEIYLYKGDMAKAEEYARESLKYPACGSCMSYTASDAYYILAYVYKSKGDHQEAERLIHTALDLSPYNVIYKKFLSELSS